MISPAAYAERLARGTMAAGGRVLLLFAVLLMVTDALQRFVSQVAPASWWFELSRVEIQPPGTVTIIYRRARQGNLPVSSIIELLGPGGEQPCASSGKAVIESDTTFAVAPIARLLPNCAWSSLPDGNYGLDVTVTYTAPGGFQKFATVKAVNSIMVRNGAIIGATPLPGSADGS